MGMVHTRTRPLGAGFLLLASTLAACPRPTMPSGPPPEYEPPPRPSWLVDDASVPDARDAAPPDAGRDLPPQGA